MGAGLSMASRREAGTIAFGNETYDGQFQRTLSASYAGMADLGEAFATARAIGKPDPDRWYNGWFAPGGVGTGVAIAAAAAGHGRRARGAYLRASEYYRQAYFFLRRDWTTPSLQRAYAAQVAAFQAAIPLLDIHVEEIAMPFARARR